jgi:hypothetical protein
MQNPPSTVSRRLRFAAWIIAATGALTGQLLPRAGRGISLVFLGILLILLLTTPRDAIRLPRRVSEILILGGEAGIQLLAHHEIRGWMLLVTAALLIVLRFTNQSAWWAALFAWWPV